MRVSKGELRRREKRNGRKVRGAASSGVVESGYSSAPIGTGLKNTLTIFDRSIPEIRELMTVASVKAAAQKKANDASPGLGVAFSSAMQREMALRICAMLDVKMFRRKGEKRTTLNFYVSEDFYRDTLGPLFDQVFAWQDLFFATASAEIERVLFQEITGGDFSYECLNHGIKSWKI